MECKIDADFEYVQTVNHCECQYQNGETIVFDCDSGDEREMNIVLEQVIDWLVYLRPRVLS